MLCCISNIFPQGILETVARRCSIRKGILRNFAKFTGKHLCQSLFFNKTLLKQRPWHRFFPVNFTKFLRTPFLTEHLRWLLLGYYMISQPCLSLTESQNCCFKNLNPNLVVGSTVNQFEIPVCVDNSRRRFYFAFTSVFISSTTIL